MSAIGIGILPIIILLVVLFLLSNLVSRINNSGKNIRWMLIGYIGLLIISTIVYFLLPIEGEMASEALEADEIQLQGIIEGDSGSTVIHDPLYTNLENGTMEELDPSYIREKWSFTYEEEELSIQSIIHDEMTYLPIYVEQVEEAEQSVEVIYYQLPMIIENRDISKLTSSPEIDLNSTTLSIEAPLRKDFRFATFKPAFPLRQFSGERLMPMGGYGYSNEMVYIRVPKNIQLDVDEEIAIVGSEGW